MAIIGHCWHKNRGRDTREEICCYCGITWTPESKVHRPEHGDHDPDPIRKEKPSGQCHVRMGKMKWSEIQQKIESRVS